MLYPVVAQPASQSVAGGSFFPSFFLLPRKDLFPAYVIFNYFIFALVYISPSVDRANVISSPYSLFELAIDFIVDYTWMYNGTSDDLNFIIRYFLPSLFR